MLSERWCCNVLHCTPANIMKVCGCACPVCLWRCSLPGLARKSGKSSALLQRFSVFWLIAVSVLIPSLAWAVTGDVRWLQVYSLPLGTAVLGFTGLQWQYGNYTLLSTGKSVIQFLLKKIWPASKPCICTIACKNCCFSEQRILDFAFCEMQAAVAVFRGANSAVWHAPDRRNVTD